MADANLPLHGTRVLDLGIITAGAATSALLADLGADVVKIEAPNYIDPFRVWVDFDRKNDWWNNSPYFRFTNRSKRSLCLNLKAPRGRELFLRLVAISDVVVENFRRGVMDRLDIGVEVLFEANPKLVIASISSQGETGPERDVSSFGSTLEATSGMACLTGAVDGPPVLTGRDLNYPDQVVSLFAAGMIAAALSDCKRTGSGVRLDVSQRELSTFLIGEKFMSDRSLLDREGNADCCAGGQTVARAADGVWVAATAGRTSAETDRVGSGKDESRLRRLIGDLPSDQAVERLVARGFAASAVLDGRAIRRADWFTDANAIATTSEGELVKGFPFQFRETPMRVARPTAALGQDNEAILRDLLHLSESEIAALTEAGVVGDRPSDRS